MPAYHNNLLRHKALEVIKDDLQTTFKEEFDLTDILKKNGVIILIDTTHIELLQYNL